ncbi:MAG: hypothetical protein EWV80_17875 [Microcystis aeruginosa Ma_QC_B_20070730_S2]|uniref:Type I restriction modification DNA specificity domain-containing protein n=4 Tax=Microcystis TaxID=1125 RepID=A0A552DDX9_MICAE|nr:MAG: hypothetical protein EWV80_17875 [Microcystis aeruginosa Ma_QC_B_20070730_S2]
MKKNGHTFLTIVDTCKIEAGIWNPYHYKKNDLGYTLSDFVDIQKIINHKCDISLCHFAPIEYKNIPKGELLTFVLEDNYLAKGRYSVVGEQSLIFGTMRAYLGNVLVTPKATWIEKDSPLFYPINSEFVEIIPKDKLPYFWWCYLKSALFLHQMPAGSGGTRPRVSIENLEQIPVSVPTLQERTKINSSLIVLAEQSWQNLLACRQIMKQANLSNNQ